MKRVAGSESAMLTIARAIVRLENVEAAEPLMRRPRAMPRSFGLTSLSLLRETLLRGAVLELVRRGGGKRRPYLSDSTVKETRLWERHAPPSLRFSSYVIEVLRWLVSSPLRENTLAPLTARPQTAADQFFAYLVLDLARHTEFFYVIGAHLSFRTGGLVWLGFWDDLTLTTSRAFNLPEESDFAQLCTGDGLVVLEALLPELAARYTAAILRRGELTAPAHVVALAEVETALFGRFMNAAAKAGRSDLARFLIEGAASAMNTFREPSRFIERLHHTGGLAERMNTRRSALAFHRVLENLHAWAQIARGARFFDDEYAASQLYLRLWEPIGDTGYERAVAMAKNIELLPEEGVANT